MHTLKFDVIIIGAGPAGVTAAGALAGSGVTVALLEAGVYAGAENWSGCVYFSESLAENDCFGPAAVQAAPFERQVALRGTLIHNGIDVAGLDLADPAAFRHCYTVLRPVYDPYFAALAARKGAAHLTGITVTSLLRKRGRVAGVQTNRGALLSDVVFIAEGDASHLVAAERLERVRAPHFLQGVKAVLNLAPEEIDRRFGLDRGEGAAYELLIRNASLAGRTAHLNVGGFLYTNRDSLSLGYVVPLDNLKKHYRGDHGRLFEWMRALPMLGDLTRDATLSAYGAKIIRSGGWTERPVLVEDGLAVGGASAGLGIDLPFPNFTGPASATGLYFARAVRALLKEGRSFDRKNLTRAYVDPLKESVYGRNAVHLARWPVYFGRSRALFGRTADLVCGTARFLASDNPVDAGRFIRGRLLSLRAARELVADTIAAIRALRLGMPLCTTLADPRTLAAWVRNQVSSAPRPDPRLRLVLRIGGRTVDALSLPWPAGAFLKRIAPSLGRALAALYANDSVPMERKLALALRTLIRGLRLTDLIVLPASGLALLLIAAGTAAWDAFRFYIMKLPVDRLLAEPVPAYDAALRQARDLDAVKPVQSLEARLATNTYRVGSESHIRTLWPAAAADHPRMSQAALWQVCPARVYGYDAPLLGRGAVTVNWENCIKCETCWRAEPERTLWGRFTDHALIYRPATAAMADLLQSLERFAGSDEAGKQSQSADPALWYLQKGIAAAVSSVLNAGETFRDAVANLPASADAGRLAWPLQLGDRLIEQMTRLENLLVADGRSDAAGEIREERAALGRRLAEGRLFHSLYALSRLEQELRSWTPVPARPPDEPRDSAGLSRDEVERLFPDRVVKQWEEEAMPEEWAAKLRQFLSAHRHPARPAIRALAALSPALGLIAAHQAAADRIVRHAGRDPVDGACVVDGRKLVVLDSGVTLQLVGSAELVPMAACGALMVIAEGRAFLIPRAAQGIKTASTPAIGFRAAGLSRIDLNCAVPLQDSFPFAGRCGIDPVDYLTIALGAADYLSRRANEHAAGRVQFPGQMLDTQGRDGVAKLGAVKAMLSRIESWRLLLETLYRAAQRMHGAVSPEFETLCAATAALAFGPENGGLAYDAGQVFGGFAFSEDDLLSRFYRDSSLFRFLAPGYGASAALHAAGAAPDLRTLCRRELGTVDGLTGAPLAPLATRWYEARTAWAAIPAAADRDLAGDAAVLLLGSRGLLAAAEETIASGRSGELEAACAEVLLGLTEQAVMRAALSAGRGGVAPDAFFPVAPDISAVDLGRDYESFCTRPGRRHRSGDFLVSVFDRAPRYVPEMQLHDPRLRPLWRELVDWFRGNASGRSFEGMHFERQVERLHNLPDEIIDAVKRNKWLATYVSASEDGLGWHKADYYILNSAAGSFGDAAVCLLIMASTSIGTTPALLGLDEELPRVREELTPLVDDPKRLGEIGSRITRLAASFANPNPGWIRKEYGSLMKLVDGRIRRTRVVKYLAANFLRAFYGAGIAGRRGDFEGFIANLTQAAGLFKRVMPDVREALEELPRRERAHRLFLRNLGHGGVSAFALTEPTAGSDSGGVRTTAVLRSAMLAALPDGRYAFSPTGELDKCRRYLIDADRIVFTDGGMAYRAPDDTLCPIRYDGYDYAADEGARAYEYRGARCEFHDIGQVRTTATGPRYEYYSLTGAKMWITNGSLATQFSLYAQTPEGVTGFLVDRHAEGLKVGADERKMGQRGSPTNELSLDGVRVPREAVIGYEGHGQVNALETLNVGRCGLAVVAGAIARKLLTEALEAVPPSEARDRLLGEAAAVQFGSESLAYCLIGLFDRPHDSVRMESAVAKYVCSEDAHEIISLIERAYGPAGQTERHLLEKARRDSRILNIYEGTNEVQRFLILKDLISRAADWPELPERVPERPRDGAAMTLTRWKNRLRNHVRASRERFGDAAWSDAMLQPALFPLSEMAGEILRLECSTWRMEWLAERRELLGQAYVDPLLKAGTRASERALATLDHLDRVFLRAWQQLSRGFAVPEVRAADAALDRAAAKEVPVAATEGSVTGPIRILALLRPVADLPPAPRMRAGTLRELVWEPDPLDRSGLEQALALKAAGGRHVTVHVLMPGGPERERLLRTAAPSADRLIRLDHDAADAAALAAAVKELERDNVYDLIIAGTAPLDGGQGIAPFLAGSLRRPYQPLARLRAKQDGSGIDGVLTPSVAGITALSTGPAQNADALVKALSLPIAVLQRRTVASSPAFRFTLPAGAAAEQTTCTTVREAAAYLKDYAAAARSGAAEAYAGPVRPGRLAEGPVLWSLLDPMDEAGNRAALRACRIAADLFGRTACALIPAPRDRWPALLGLARLNGADRAFCLDTFSGTLSRQGRLQVLGLAAENADSPVIVAGSAWSDAAAETAGAVAAQRTVQMAMGVTGVERDADGTLTVAIPAYAGRLVRQERIRDGSAFLTVSSVADLPGAQIREGFSTAAVEGVVQPGWTAPLPPPQEPTLANADVIIDLGYGVKDRAGLALAEELKKRLEGMGLVPLFGATRKVTQDLKLLPLEVQIGQTGVRVNPKLVIALGISGAPQHIDWIGTRAEILCFNKDPEAPLMTLNRTRATPRVHPIAGDLFVTVRELIEKLG